MLFDGGRLRLQAAEILTDMDVRRLDLVVASHGDEDHVGGLVSVLAYLDVDSLVVPAWLSSRVDVVPLLRAARRRGTRVLTASRGTSISLSHEALEVLWPEPRRPARSDNESSLAIRLRTDAGAILLLADQGAGSEARMARLSEVRCSVLLASHHGSRSSTSLTLLDEARPRIVLIPAGPGNLHGHPHRTVLARLEARRLLYRCPFFDGACGAYVYNGHWMPYP